MPDPFSISGNPNSSPLVSGLRYGCQSVFSAGCCAARRIRRLVGQAAPAVGAAFAAASLVGCGHGGVAFDGGHIPVGGGVAATNVSGVVLQAENATAPVPGATVTVTNVSFTGAKKTQITTSAADGTFLVSAMPDVANTNEYEISVTPPAGSDRISQQYAMPVTAGQSISLLASLPLASFNQTQAASVVLQQQNYQLHNGDTIQVNAELLNAQGGVVAETPALAFVGTFGSFQPGGYFTSTTTGNGTVTAFWYTGVQLLESPIGSVVSNVNVSHLPPPPPP